MNRNVTQKQGRPKVYATNADRQAAYRARTKLAQLGISFLIEELQHALDRGHSHRLVDDLPDTPFELCTELAHRLQGVKLVSYRVS